MAKGNLFLGMGRGKVGDVVFYRMNGRQMSRVRNRDPKNPRSNEQLYQRAVIATVMKAYSAGKEIYDHSFQGYTVGEGCMRRFNSVNARILREQLANDINGDVQQPKMKGRFVWPKSTESVPVYGMQVSEGTLVNKLIVSDVNTEFGTVDFKFADPLTDETIYAYLDRMGTAPGDIYTFVFHLVNTLDGTPAYRSPFGTAPDAQGWPSAFGYVRLTVKKPTIDFKVNGGGASEIFIIEQGGNGVSFNAGVQTLVDAEGKGAKLEFSTPKYDMGCAACIRSRLDIDVRSTAYMNFWNDNTYGISSYYVLATWLDEVQKIGTSELILEGGELDGGASAFPKTAEEQALLAEEGTLANYPTNEGRKRSNRHRGTTNEKR